MKLPDPLVVGQAYRKRVLVWAVRIDKPFEVETPEGVMRGEAGDYLCKHLAGEVWPVKRELFERNYEAV